MDVDATNFGERVVGLGDFSHRVRELASPLSWCIGQQLPVRGRGSVARREDWLLSSEQIGRAIVGCVFVERAAVTFEHVAESLVGPLGNLGELLVGGGTKLMKAQRTLVISHVHAIEHEAMKVYVQPQRGVGALDEGADPLG